MAVRTYKAWGYRNTGYSPGVPGESEFDRPLSVSVFEGLYPDGDSDVIALNTVNSDFLLRSGYYKDELKIQWTGTQKDIIHQVDYLKLQATEGTNPETLYFFVNAADTIWEGATTLTLSIELDEMTTSDASQTAEISGIIEKRNYGNDEPLNFYPENFTQTEPLQQTVAYITAETATGYTVYGGIEKTSGVREFAAVFCDLGGLLQDPPVVKELPPGADALTVTIEGAGGATIALEVPGMVLVDLEDAQVKKALGRLRETGNESLLGETFRYPKQVLKSEPTNVSSNGVNLITGIAGGSFYFTIDNFLATPDYSEGIKNNKARYQHTSYTMIAPATGETHSFTLQEVIESLDNEGNITTTAKLRFIGSGLPLPQGGLYWRPAGWSMIDPVPGYDSRILYIGAVGGGAWSDAGVAVTGLGGQEMAIRGLDRARREKQFADEQIDINLELTKENIGLARMGTLYSGIGSAVGGAMSGNWLGAGAGAMQAASAFGGLNQVGFGQNNQLIPVENAYSRQYKLAERDADLARRTNALGLENIEANYAYEKRTASLGVRPPTDLGMQKVMSSSLMLIREALTETDAIRYDLELTRFGHTVKEAYSGLIKNHPKILSLGEDFSYIQLGSCTMKMPEEPSGWANSLSWKRKIQAELQTGGRLWKKKINDYIWEVPIPHDGGYNPSPGGENPLYFEKLEAIGSPSTTHLEVKLSEDLALEDIVFTITGSPYGEITKAGWSRYLIAITPEYDGAVASVKITAGDRTVRPPSRTVRMVKEFGSGAIGKPLEWMSAETPPWELGYTIEATCEISASEHYILWTAPTDEENMIITKTNKFEHVFVNALVQPYSKDRISLATVAERISVIVGGELDKLTVLDGITGGTRLIPVVGDLPMLGKTSFKNFIVERYGLLYPDGSGFAYYTGTMRLYPLQTQSKVLTSKFGIPLYKSYPLWTIKSVTYSGGPTTTMEDLSIRTHLSESESMDGNPFHSGLLNSSNFKLELATAGGLALGKWDGVQGLYKMNFGSELLPVERLEAGISVYGASYSNGVYIQKGGNLVYRYDSGEEVIVESPLPAMQVKDYEHPFYTDGVEVYRIKG